MNDDDAAAIGALNRKARECFFGTASEAPACEALPPETKRSVTHLRHISGKMSGSRNEAPGAYPGRLLLLRTSAIFCELTLTREGCRDFRRGDGSAACRRQA